MDDLREISKNRPLFDALDQVCLRVEEQVDRMRKHDGILARLAELHDLSNRARDRIAIEDRKRGVFHIVRTGEIDWIEAKDGGVLIHEGKETFPSRRSLGEMETCVGPGTFLRVHRSFLVNRARIRTVQPLWKGEYIVTLASGRSIGTGRTYREAVEGFLSCG